MFRTELSLRPAAALLPQGARVLTIGSCFSDVLGARLTGHKVRALTNPFGTVFNPLAAARLLRAAAGEETDWQQHLVQARGRWQSYDLHSTVGADSPPELLDRIEQLVRETAEFARRADVLVWTLGTAFAYRLRDTNEVVSNCHKVPAERFEKELLTAEEIVSAVTEAYALLRQQNPRLQLILTVSPVRHLKDTLPLNAVSKSVLRVACHYLSELLPGASYFPAYELLLDDLRDYRFYGADMLHPSEMAEQYVWEKFLGVYFEPGVRQFVQEWDGIQRALNHRPLHEGAPEHREFLEQTLRRLERLAPRVDVRAELRDVQQRISALPVSAPTPEPEPLDDDEERIDIGYEDAVIPPAEKPSKPVEAVAAPKPAEPTWAEILSAAEAAEEAETEEEATTATSAEEETGNEAEAALPAEPGAGKRRKRKRGGRKHKKKPRPTEEGDEAATAEGEAEATEPAASEAPTAEADTVLPVAQPELLTEAGTPATLPPVEAPAPTDPLPTSGNKRRNRGRRKKPALYAEVPAETNDETPETPAAEATEAEQTPATAADIRSTEVAPAVAEVPVVFLPAAADAASVAETVAASAVENAEETPEPAPTAAAETVESAAEASDDAATAPVEMPAAAAPVTERTKPKRAPRPPRRGKAAQTLDAAAETLPIPEAPVLPVLPELPAVSEIPASEAAAESAPEAAVTPKRKAAPRRKPAAKATPKAPEAAPEPVATPAPHKEPEPDSPADMADAAAPKRRSRAPRRKPQTPDAG